jgi:hypothetical protein
MDYNESQRNFVLDSARRPRPRFAHFFRTGAELKVDGGTSEPSDHSFELIPRRAHSGKPSVSYGSNKSEPNRTAANLILLSTYQMLRTPQAKNSVEFFCFRWLWIHLKAHCRSNFKYYLIYYLLLLNFFILIFYVAENQTRALMCTTIMKRIPRGLEIRPLFDRYLHFFLKVIAFKK